MSNQKSVGRSNTETRTSSSPMHNTDTFRTLVGGEGRTSRVTTNSTSVSEEALETTAAYTEMIRSGVLVQDSSSLLENKRADSSQRTVDIAGPETVSLKGHSPRTAFYSLLEDSVTGEFHWTGTEMANLWVNPQVQCCRKSAVKCFVAVQGAGALEQMIHAHEAARGRGRLGRGVNRVGETGRGKRWGRWADQTQEAGQVQR